MRCNRDQKAATATGSQARRHKRGAEDVHQRVDPTDPCAAPADPAVEAVSRNHRGPISPARTGTQEAGRPNGICPNSRGGVFDAWQHAHQDIYAAWSHMTDVANLQHEVQLALRQAAEARGQLKARGWGPSVSWTC